MKFNINDQATVRLTDYGKRILTSEHRRFKLPDPAIPEDGRYKCSLWAMMITFGLYMSMTATEMVFVDNEIEILKNN